MVLIEEGGARCEEWKRPVASLGRGVASMGTWRCGTAGAQAGAWAELNLMKDGQGRVPDAQNSGARRGCELYRGWDGAARSARGMFCCSVGVERLSVVARGCVPAGALACARAGLRVVVLGGSAWDGRAGTVRAAAELGAALMLQLVSVRMRTALRSAVGLRGGTAGTVPTCLEAVVVGRRHVIVLLGSRR